MVSLQNDGQTPLESRNGIEDGDISDENSSSSSEDNGPLNLKADDEWQDLEGDNEELQVASLFDKRVFGGLDEFLAYTKKEFDFDLLEVVRRHDLDFYGCIRLINYIRASIQDGIASTSIQLQERDQFDSDKYLMPVLEDDALLFSVDEILDLASRSKEPSAAEAKSSADGNSSGQETAVENARIVELEEALARLQSQFLEYRSAVERTLEQRWTDRTAPSGPVPSSSTPAKDSTAVVSQARDEVKDDENDSFYFNSYAYNSIHETMLKDTVRTSSYRDFIYSQKHLFANKTVLDVGCGTGILSMFSAKAGAKRVFAVDNSDIIVKAREIVACNGLQDVVTCVRGKVEEVKLPFREEPNRPRHNNDTELSATISSGGESAKAHDNKVDILVSEWMGYCLLYESMLDSVIAARDAHLHPTHGIMAPSHCTLHIAPLASPDYVADTVGFWSDVYGFDMQPMISTGASTTPASISGTSEPAATTAEPEASLYTDIGLHNFPASALPTKSAIFKTLDLRSITAAELSWQAYEAPFEVVLEADIDALDAWVVWFDTFFLPGVNDELPVDARAEKWPRDDDTKGVAFTTGPGGKETHWATGVLLIDHKRKFEGLVDDVHDNDEGEHGATSGATKGNHEGKGKGNKHKGKSVLLVKGQKITGFVGYSKRVVNPRELEIEVRWEAEGTEERGRQVWIMR